MEEAPQLHTLKRHLDEPKLELGATVALKEGAVGIVIARYTPSGPSKEIRYILRVESKEHRNRKL